MKPIKYKVLAVHVLSERCHAEALNRVATIFTGEEARLQSCRRNEQGEMVNADWQYEIVDRLGQCGILKYHGVGIALFYRRQVLEVEPLPIDPVPERVIKDPSDCWVRLDLLGPSAKQMGKILGKRARAAEADLLVVNRRLHVKEELIGKLETQLFHAEARLGDCMNQIEALKSKLKEVKA